MNQYELMFIVSPSGEDGLDEIKQKIEGVITGREGALLSYEKLGKKRLAYPIAKQQYGIYFLANVKGDARIVHALDYFLRLHPNVIRHILISFSDKQLNLRVQTEKIQLEEAERMRQGGRPMGAGPEDVLAAIPPVKAILTDEGALRLVAEPGLAGSVVGSESKESE